MFRKMDSDTESNSTSNCHNAQSFQIRTNIVFSSRFSLSSFSYHCINSGFWLSYAMHPSYYYYYLKRGDERPASTQCSFAVSRTP